MVSESMRKDPKALSMVSVVSTLEIITIEPLKPSLPTTQGWGIKVPWGYKAQCTPVTNLNLAHFL